jgi:ABC-type anion transport system duplicated permease subunit
MCLAILRVSVHTTLLVSFLVTPVNVVMPDVAWQIVVTLAAVVTSAPILGYFAFLFVIFVRGIWGVPPNPFGILHDQAIPALLSLSHGGRRSRMAAMILC